MIVTWEARFHFCFLYLIRHSDSRCYWHIIKLTECFYWETAVLPTSYDNDWSFWALKARSINFVECLIL